MIPSFIDTVTRQKYQPAYYLQILPVFGAVVSAPTAIISGITAIGKIAQEIFQICKESFFSQKLQASTRRPINDAKDLSLIFINNMVNILTLGITNSILVNLSLKHMGQEYMEFARSEQGF